MILKAGDPHKQLCSRRAYYTEMTVWQPLLLEIKTVCRPWIRKAFPIPLVKFTPVFDTWVNKLLPNIYVRKKSFILFPKGFWLKDKSSNKLYIIHVPTDFLTICLVSFHTSPDPGSFSSFTYSLKTSIYLFSFCVLCLKHCRQ